MARCDCCDLPDDLCTRKVDDLTSKAARAEDRNRRAEMLSGVWIQARFRGSCAGCGDYFRVGDPIRHKASVGWIGECCQ